MGVKERIETLKNYERDTRRIAEEEERKREEERDKRYTEELSPTLLAQRKLFEELVKMGIIGMLEEMTFPQKIRPLPTPEEREENMKRMRKKAKTLLGTIPKSEVRKAFENADKQEWQGVMMPPRQLENDSLNQTLFINVYKGSYRSFNSLKTVSVSYSHQGVLIIQGNEVTFSKLVMKTNVDGDAIEEALAEAFLHPKIEEASNRSNVYNPNLPAG